MTIFKSMIIALAIHVVLFSLVWVGFPVPIPRDGVVFLYSGSYESSPESFRGGRAGKANFMSVRIKVIDAGFFGPWIDRRNLNKPKK